MTKRGELNADDGGFERSAGNDAGQNLQKSIDKNSVEKLTEEEKKTLQKRQEIGSSFVSGAFADSDGKGGLPSAKDVLGQFAHGEDGVPRLHGRVSFQDSAIVSAVSDVSAAIGTAISNSSEQLSQLIESGKDATGLNQSAIREVHAPTGDMSTLPAGVRNLEDVVHEGLGAVKGLAEAVDEIGKSATPEGIKHQAEALAKGALDGTINYVRRQVDPIGAFQADLKKVGEITNDITNWATIRSAETFGERGRDAGELIPVLEGGQGFIARKRSGLTESMTYINERDVAKLLRKSVKEVESMAESEIKDYARNLDINLTKIEKVGDPPRMPINWQYSGRTYKFDESELMKKDPAKAIQLAEKYPYGVEFKENGFPDFSPYVARLEDGTKVEVKIALTGDRIDDFDLCNQKFGWKKTPKGFTWHHHEDATTLQLLPGDLHYNVKHTGGCATSGLPYGEK